MMFSHIEPADSDLHYRVSQFLYHEAELLDAREWDAWNALFAPDGIYWVPAEPGQDDARHHVSLAYDTPLLREIRLRRLKEADGASLKDGWASSHHVSNVVVANVDGERVTVRSRLIVAQHAAWGRACFHAACTHTLLIAGDMAPRIALKRVDLLGADGPLGDIVAIF